MKRFPARAGVGSSSILLIIVVLCLTAFSTLAFITARLDLRLTRETVAGAEAYYAADARMQERLAGADAALRSNPDAAGDGVYRLTESVSDRLQLTAELTRAGLRYRILSYRTEPAGGWTGND